MVDHAFNLFSRRVRIMKDKRSLHLKVQELCDCFATADPLQEMSRLGEEPDTEEGALKWLALAILHGINSNARKVTIRKMEDGQVRVTEKDSKSEWPVPKGAIADKIMEVMKGITHIEEEKGKTLLAIGIRDSSIEVKVKIKQDENGEKIKIKFPK
jgi:hypothetical protein